MADTATSDCHAEIIVLKGKQYILFDKLVAVPAYKLRELLLRDYARWKRVAKDKG